MTEKFKSFLAWLKLFPLWLRSVLLVLISAIVLILSTSCGQMVKVTVKDTPNGVSISTTQMRKDTSGTNISINPNINFK